MTDIYQILFFLASIPFAVLIIMGTVVTIEESRFKGTWIGPTVFGILILVCSIAITMGMECLKTKKDTKITPWQIESVERTGGWWLKSEQNPESFYGEKT